MTRSVDHSEPKTRSVDHYEPKTRSVDYYLSIHSTWAYLGHDVFLTMARRHGVAIAYKPVALRDLFPQTGGLVLAERHPARQRYRLVEMQRWREARGVEMQLKPEHVPFDPTLGDRIGVALAARPDICGRFYSTAMRGVWTGQNLADEATLRAHVTAAGADADAVLAAARSPEIAERHEANRGDALAADVFGSPSYVLDGEVFWGQDRLDMLEEAILTERAPYRPA